MRALRAFALEASLARIASVSPKNDQDRKLMAMRVGDATRRAQLVLACAFKQNVVPIPGVQKDPCFYFDSLMVDYTTALFDLAMIALPIEDAKNLINLIPVGGVPDPAAALNMLSGLVAIAKDALKYGRLIGAIYRDTVELEVQVWLLASVQDQSRIPAPYVISDATVAELKAAYDRGNDDLAEWQAQIAALRAIGLEPIPDMKFIDEISYLIYYLCGQITSDKDGVLSSLAQCRYPWTTLPTGSWIVTSDGTAGKSKLVLNSLPPAMRSPPALAPKPVVAAVAADELTAYYNKDKKEATKQLGNFLLSDQIATLMTDPMKVYTIDNIVNKPGYEKIRAALFKMAQDEHLFDKP